MDFSQTHRDRHCFTRDRFHLTVDCGTMGETGDETMSRMDAKSLLEQLTPALQRQLRLPVRDHDGARLPVKRKARSASQIVQEFRRQLRLAEELVAKLGYQLRELQVLRTLPPAAGPLSHDHADQMASMTEPPAATAKIIKLRRRVKLKPE